MIPRLAVNDGLRQDCIAFLDALRAGGFTGDVHTDFATRLVAATDNSVYQIIPQAVIYPRSHDDVVLAMQLLDEPRFHRVTVNPRGGGTGTGGQSLNTGVVIDVSRHMRRIVEINAAEGYARVEPGVVLDQLNAALKLHGCFFAPTVAPGDRATLGGMIATDAAGEGSCIYGKTSNHIVELTTVLAGGPTWLSRELDTEALEEIMQREDPPGRIHRCVDKVLTEHAGLIERRWPRLPRFVSGYNLAMVRGAAGEGRFNLNWLLAGSEGTLGIVTEAKLRITPLPKHRLLVVLKYAAFDDALAAAPTIARFRPHAIETMDETLLDLARTDETWLLVKGFLDDPIVVMRTVSLVEFAGDRDEAVTPMVDALIEHLRMRLGEPEAATGWCVVSERPQRDAMWALRKRAVGLLSNMPGARKPVPFVEDAAVPPEHLRDFVCELRAVLDAHSLDYGMFGHVDAGCLHVRPALDMTDPADAAMLPPISDAVASLAQKYGGVLWGEHGKGMRSEYNPAVFGPELYAAMRRIKQAFDPRNQLNPGKIASPGTELLTHDGALLTIDATTRGSYDRQVPLDVRRRYDDAIRCNGNGQCYSEDPHYVMCPSWKGTRDRIHSPKGRAAVMREWLRRLSAAGGDAHGSGDAGPTSGWARKRDDEPDFSHEVYDAMQGCLACKACAGQCPAKVDVPDFRADFLERYHTRYRRPLRDHLIGRIEDALPLLAKLPGAVNAVQRTRLFRRAMERWGGLVDVPPLAVPTLAQLLPPGDSGGSRMPFDPHALSALSEQEKSRCVLIVQDAFTSFYRPRTVVALCDLLSQLGYAPTLVPLFPSGKSLHVRGFVSRFRQLARRNARRLDAIASLGMDMVGIDPAITLLYRDEYVKALGQPPAWRIELIQEWLARRLQVGQLSLARRRNAASRHRLFLHCTERALAPHSVQQWCDVFAAFGMSIEVVRAGCCGMGGAWGHEAVNATRSRAIFDLSWGEHLAHARDGILLATGYSCRSQVKRFAGRDLAHPVESLCQAAL
jgi:FAD/FMN-containing dehydrogenase/Fe-S oxidoreductase